MKTLKIIIERSEDMFSAYAENAENIPSILKGKYDIVYHFDAENFLNYYKGIFTNAALEKITGINQRQLQQLIGVEKAPSATA